MGNEEPEEGLDGNGKEEVDQEVEVEGGVEMNVEEAVNIPGGEDEVLALRAARAPTLPSTSEIEAHELTHCPPRSWCEQCVRGQAKDSRHVTVQGEFAESSVTRVSMDYCFLTEDVSGKDGDHEVGEKAKTSLTVLVMTETMCRSIWAYACESKGSGEQWIIEQILEDLETIGISEERIILKTDQESSMTDIQKAIAKARAGHGTALENSRVGDSDSKGKVERAIQDLCGLVRTLRSDLESKIGSKVHLDNPAVPWIIRHAGHLINLCRVRDNGRTAFQLMKGRRTNAKLVPFGESVLFKIPKTDHRVGKFEDRWEAGCWVGFLTRTGEHLVATGKGAFKVSTVMRSTCPCRTPRSNLAEPKCRRQMWTSMAQPRNVWDTERTRPASTGPSIPTSAENDSKQSSVSPYEASDDSRQRRTGESTPSPRRLARCKKQ